MPDLAGVDFALMVLKSEAALSVTALESTVEIVQSPVIIYLDAGTQANWIVEIAHALSART